MSIKRATRPKVHFTIIANEVLRDDRLSFRARGVLASILSRPDNWKTTSESLARESKEGRSAILSALKELEEIGYLVRNKYQNDKGQWISESVVFDKPQTDVEKPKFGYPTSGEPTSENLPLLEEPIKNERKEETISPRIFDDEVKRLANLLADLVADNGIKRPTVTDSWHQDIERLHRIDGYGYDQIERTIRWVQSDSFWRSNVLSASKLRKQFGALQLKMKSSGGGLSGWAKVIAKFEHEDRQIEQ